MLHWQKRDFSSQEQLNQRRIKSAKKKKKSLSLWCVWAAKGVFVASIIETYQIGSLQDCRDITAASSACPSGSVGVEQCLLIRKLHASVFGKVPITGNKRLSPHCWKTLFTGIRGKKEECHLTSEYHPNMKLSQGFSCHYPGISPNWDGTQTIRLKIRPLKPSHNGLNTYCAY